MTDQSLRARFSRRSLLRGASAAALSASVLPAGFLASTPVMAAAAGEIRARSLKEVLAMTPVDMARESAAVQAAQKMLEESARRLPDQKLSKTILEIFRNPAPTVAAQDGAALLEKLKAEKMIDAGRASALPPCKSAEEAPQPFWSAPGSGYASHHAYPGGLATHTALNVASAEKLCESYDAVFGLKLDPNAAVGGELLHDLHKPWVFQWQADGSCRKEEPLAGTGEHHILSLAESMKRGVPAAVCVAQAMAHTHAGTQADEAQVVRWIKAAAIIAGKDPVAEGFLAPDGRTVPLPRRIEGFAVHLADHDFVISGPACQWAAEALYALGREKYGLSAQKDLNALRNYALANLTAMRLYGILSAEGKDAFAAEVARAVKA